MAKPQYEDSFFGEPAPKTKKRAAKPPAVKVFKSSTNIDDQMKAIVERKQAVFASRLEARDFDMEEAIKMVAPLLSPESRAENADILDPYYNNKDLKQRVEDWRQEYGNNI